MNIIKEKREEKGLTQREVADLLKLSQPAYFQVENGQRKIKGLLKKNLMQILDLKESDLTMTASEQIPEISLKELTEENIQLKESLKWSEEINLFFVEHYHINDKKESFISTLWFYLQDRNKIAYPEKFAKIAEWESENQSKLVDAIVNEIAPESCYPPPIKKLYDELEKIRMYYIEKAMYESTIFKFLKDHRLLNKTEISNYKRYRKIDPKTVK